jgi:steroid delta-isomerase-like uncharacterized protein
MTAQEERHQRYVEAWNRHDPEAVVAQFGDGGLYEPLPMEHSFSGDALERFVRMVMKAFPDLTLRVLRRISAGELLIAEWEIGGTHLGEFLGVPPTGEYAIVRGCDVAEFAPDGCIRANHVYWDSATVARQIGVGAMPCSPSEGNREEGRTPGSQATSR